MLEIGKTTPPPLIFFFEKQWLDIKVSKSVSIIFLIVKKNRRRFFVGFTDIVRHIVASFLFRGNTFVV